MKRSRGSAAGGPKPRPVSGILAAGIVVTSAVGLAIFFMGPFGMDRERGIVDSLFFAILCLRVPWGAFLLARQRPMKKSGEGTTGESDHSSTAPAQRTAPSPFTASSRAVEIFLSLETILFLFSFIYASNANMDYVQRFAASSGNIRLAPDSFIQRMNSIFLFLPPILWDWWVFIRTRLPVRPVRTRLGREDGKGAARRTVEPTTAVAAAERAAAGTVAAVPAVQTVPAGGITATARTLAIGVWGLPLALLSGLLYALSFPSFLVPRGIPGLGFIALIPLLAALRKAPFRWGLLEGVAGMTIGTMITNYWLGTFSLVSLQLITVVSLLWYLLLFIPLISLARRGGLLGILTVSCAWALFDYLRSLGFLGYPWGMIGTSLYLLTPMIQMASLTGVWGVNWLALFTNAAGPESFLSVVERKPVPARIAAAAAVALVCVTAAGGISILRETRKAGENRRTARPEESITIALVQQNTDPRKDDYEKSFTVLRTLTDQAVEGDPGLVVWSETAFVPNIRRWGAMDPAAHPYASLVRRFRDYQRGLGRWLLTGNDDYENVSLTDPADGSVTTERKDYNAAVLFSDRGERMETYRKIRLVPFTESFPYRETFPRLYQFLLDFDVYLWEPGTERIVFRHPSLPFSTPICFEDSFPGEVREFVDAGAWAIINISNDFWSLTEVEAEQHLANALFRAVENRCPLLRASASGVTCQIDRTGRIRKRLPCYEEGYLLCEVEASAPPLTLYRRWGDWFPWLCGFIVILCYAIRRILPMEIR